MTDYHANVLNGALERLAGRAFLAATARRIAYSAAAIAVELTQAVLAEVPQFSASMNPDILPESARHAAQHTEEILRLLRGGGLGDFDFVREHARRRAEQRFPLEATLHAYRSGHKVLSRWLRGSPLAGASPGEDSQRDAAAVADFAMEYTDAISTIFASAYSAHTLLLADVAGDQRAELLQILLDGHDETDLRVARILRDAGFPNKRQVFCVALARSVDPAEMLNVARARRLADSIEQVMAESAMRRIIDVHANKVTMVFADVRRESGWTAPRSSLALRMSEALKFVGNAALIGVSNDAPSTSHIPTAYREATAALEMALVTQRVVQFAELPMQRLLLHFAGEEFRRVLPAWANEFHVADDRAHGALTATLRAYADADMNVLQAAQTLGVHPNTLYARFERIFDISSLQARTFNALTALLIVADCKREGTVGISEAGAHSLLSGRARPRRKVVS
jgi:PucR-like helix-turn-helix protein/diguanylate cyclase with GGDEF domain